jgi:hypothetical protein
MIFVPPGYSYGQTMFDVAAVKGGSAWGVSTLAGPDGSRKPSEGELGFARHQVRRVVCACIGVCVCVCVCVCVVTQMDRVCSWWYDRTVACTLPKPLACVHPLCSQGTIIGNVTKKLSA